MLFPTTVTDLPGDPLVLVAGAVVCLLVALRLIKRALVGVATLIRAAMAAAMIVVTTVLALAMLAAAALTA